jgi:hypothetical protein
MTSALQTQGYRSDTRIEFIMLCDAAQAAPDGKLYILGGGWSQIFRNVLPPGIQLPPGQLPAPNQFAIAAGYLIDWNDANRPFNIRVAVERQQEPPAQPLFEVRAQITAGRPPQSPQGDPLRAVVAIPVLLNFPEQGSYSVRADMEGAPGPVVVRFQVTDRMAMPVPPVPPPPA